MKLTYDLIKEKIDKAVDIIKDIYPSFQYKGFTKVRISKARSKWGSVKYNRITGDFALTISNVFEDIQNDDKANEKLLNTVVHELIHTIPGCMNHGPNFKYYAALVNNKYPKLNIQRCTSMGQFGIQKTKKEPLYIATCSKCRRNWKYYRKPKLFDYISKCKCPYCTTYTLFFSTIKGIAI